MEIKRGEIILANLEPVVGSEQGRIRPVLIVQNNDSNEFSPITIVAPVTTKIYTKEFPTNVFVLKEDSGLDAIDRPIKLMIRIADIIPIIIFFVIFYFLTLI